MDGLEDEIPYVGMSYLRKTLGEFEGDDQTQNTKCCS